MERAATIITLGNASLPTVTSSFDDAFGQHSEFFGKKARARRQARRMERINNRRERRKARQEMRLEKKKRRVEGRAERRAIRSTARQRRRDERSEGKRRRERADLEQEREMNPEEEEGGGQDDGGQDEGGYAPQSRYSEDEEQGNGGQGGYDEEEGGGEDSEEFDGDYDDFDGDYDDFDGDDTDDFDGDYDDFDGDEDTDGFDGEYDDFDGNYEMSDSPVSPPVINPIVADAAQKIEWNLELASRLNDKASMSPSPKITDTIADCQNRVAQLESSMDGYCNFDGDFMSTADGKLKYQFTRGMKPLSIAERKKRWQEVRAARLKARAERNAMRMKNGLPQVQTPVIGAAANPMKAQMMQLRNMYRKQMMQLKMQMVALRKQYLVDASKPKSAQEKLSLKQNFVARRNILKANMVALRKQYIEQVNAAKMQMASLKPQATSSVSGNSEALMQLRNQYRKRITILKMRMVALKKQYLIDAGKNKSVAEKMTLKQQFVIKRNAIKMRMATLKKQYLEKVNALKTPMAAAKPQATSSYTGVIGLDDSMDYDASSTEVKLGFAGNTTSKIPVKSIVIGLAVGALAMYLLRRYKVI
jgi:hypothetical protein